jgi:hypothetical protein
MNQLPLMDDREVALLTNSLNAAAELYEMDAKSYRERRDLPFTHAERLAKQFDDQAVRARNLIDKIEMKTEDA